MQEAVAAPLPGWENFYVIIGSAAAALTGLMFIVVTLISGIRRDPTSGTSIAAFGTPNVIHFCAALLIAATLCAPWPLLWEVSVPLALCGLGGMVYIGVVIRRARIQDTYTLVMEDWIWHIIVPFIAYTALAITAIFLPFDARPVLFFVGGVTILLLFIGIHNAWDTVTYLVSEYAKSEPQGRD